MRLILPIIASLLVFACSQQPQIEAEQIVENTTDSLEVFEGSTLKKAESYRFYIPGIFTNNFKQAIDTNVPKNFLNVNNGQLIAKKYWYNEQELTALSYDYKSDQGIERSASHLIVRDEKGDIVDVMDAIFPEMDVYAFYDFGDRHLKQLEGDEQTVFAGYKLDLSKTDSLGVQFMFCNKMDAADTDSLNADGVVKYIALEELKN